MNDLYSKYIRKDMLPTLFCPGCGNGIIQMAAIEAIEKTGLREDIACVSGIGCSSWIPCYLDMDVMHTIHGRALAFAQGLKLSRPDKKVIVFSGDGDGLAIGGNHLIHACHRNMDITMILVNNYIYGMTGGQKSPTTPERSITKTSPYGAMGEPVDGCKLAIGMGAGHVARWTTAHPVQIANTIKDAIEYDGFSYIEVLSQCPVQAGEEVYGVSEPWDIMESFKKNDAEMEIGLLKLDKKDESNV